MGKQGQTANSGTSLIPSSMTGLAGLGMDELRKKLGLDQLPASRGQYQGSGQLASMPGKFNLFDPDQLQQMLGTQASPQYSLMRSIQPRLDQSQIQGMSNASKLGTSQGPGVGSSIAQYAPQILSALGGGRSGPLQGAAQGAATGATYGGPWGALAGGLGGALAGRRGASAASMAGTGAELGSLAGPMGTGIGAGAGALMGLLGGGKGGQKSPMKVPITPITPDMGS